jgi:small subunit ribosomal protein S1
VIIVIPHSEPPVPLETWQRFVADHADGAALTGDVIRVLPFGAIVHLGDGIHGLIHISEWVTPIEDGTKVWVRILDVDTERRRMSLVPA